MEIRLQKNEKRNISSDYHVQYAANHLEKAKDVFMKAIKLLTQRKNISSFICYNFC